MCLHLTPHQRVPCRGTCAYTVTPTPQANGLCSTVYLFLSGVVPIEGDGVCVKLFFGCNVGVSYAGNVFVKGDFSRGLTVMAVPQLG